MIRRHTSSGDVWCAGDRADAVHPGESRGRRTPWVRDRELLLDLALDLSADHGTAREAAGLVRAGVAARLARLRLARRWIAAAVLAVATVSTSAAAVSTHTEATTEVEVHQGGAAG